MSAAVWVAGALAFAVTAALGVWLIPWLRRLKYGQTILDIGPRWHQSKQGTPTMGGLMFIAGILCAAVAGFLLLRERADSLTAAQNGARLGLGLLMALAFAFIGFADDYIKVKHKENLGLTARQKLVGQFAVAICYVWGLALSGSSSTTAFFPFFGPVRLGVFYWPLAVVGLVYFVNSVNLTDGLDGLAACVTLTAGGGLLGLSLILRAAELQMLSGALMGGCLGFLVWNFYPAKVFMGDTGSMFLGGVVAAIAFDLGLPVYLGLVGVLYIIESLSVVIQMTYFRFTGGKRLFKMSPIHHHFELCGKSEREIVAAFSLVNALGAVLACWAALRL